MQTVLKVKANSIWQQELLMRASLGTTRQFAGHFLARHLGADGVQVPLTQSRQKSGVKVPSQCRGPSRDEDKRLSGQQGLRRCGLLLADERNADVRNYRCTTGTVLG